MTAWTRAGCGEVARRRASLRRRRRRGRRARTISCSMRRVLFSRAVGVRRSTRISYRPLSTRSGDIRDEAFSDCKVKPVKTASVSPSSPVIVMSLSISSRVADTTRRERSCSFRAHDRWRFAGPWSEDRGRHRLLVRRRVVPISDLEGAVDQRRVEPVVVEFVGDLRRGVQDSAVAQPSPDVISVMVWNASP